MPRWVKLGLIAAAVLLSVDTILWYWATGRVIDQTNAWVEAQRAQGWQLAMGPPSREGWPFEARIRMAQASIATPAAALRPVSRLEADSTTVGVRLWSPHTLHVGLGGQQRVQAGGRPPQTFTTAQTALVLPLIADQPPDKADLALDDLQSTFPNGALRVASVQMHGDFAAGHSTGSLHIVGAELPASQIGKALGTRIEMLAIEMAVDGPLNISPAAWKAAGGALRMPSLSLTWGNLGVTGHGEMRLDDQMQPEGTLTADVTGAAETLDALVAGGLVPPNVANVTRALLALMQKPRDDGRPMVELPFTLKNQRVQMGQFPLMRVPDVTW